MKKTTLLFLLQLFLLVSCSSSNDTNEPITAQPIDLSTVLLRRITETINGYTTSENFIYDGKKLLRVEKSNGKNKIFTYTNNLITEVNWYGVQIEKFYYNDKNQLIKKVTSCSYTDSGVNSTIEYSYNTDGTISYTVPQRAANFAPNAGIINSKNLIENDFSNEYYYPAQGNHGVITCSGGTRTLTSKYYYDTRNNPLRNIEGFKEIYFAGVTDYQGSLEHNLRVKHTYITSVVDEYPQYSCSGYGGQIQVSFTYNDNEFPKTSFYNPNNSIGSNTVAKEYFYE